MINANRIVPVTATDLISLYATMNALVPNNPLAPLAATTVNGDFVVPTSTDITATNWLCNEPVKTLKFNAGTQATERADFVAAYDYDGCYVNGSKVTTTGATVKPDGATFYRATYTKSTGAVAITKIGA